MGSKDNYILPRGSAFIEDTSMLDMKKTFMNLYLDESQHNSHQDYEERYVKNILSTAVVHNVKLSVDESLKFSLNDEKLENVIKLFENNNYNLIKHSRKYNDIYLFIEENIFNSVMLYVSKEASSINCVFTYRDEESKTEILDVLSCLDKNDYAISLDTYAKDCTESFETNMCCVDFKQSPDFYYPNIEEGLSSYFEAFVHSTSNILLIIGPPGTGKTNFLKSLFNYAKQDVQLTYDEKLIESGSYFADFLQSKKKFLVIEDADTILTSRSEGNNLISKFLNTADGIVPNTKKKLIFTTNLPNVRDVDKALIRPGRCFDVLEIGYLNKEQAEKIANHIQVDLSNLNKDKYTLAEIYALKNTTRFHSKLATIGFI
jgi:hypothetical protein